MGIYYHLEQSSVYLVNSERVDTDSVFWRLIKFSLTLSLRMTQEAFVDSVDQDQIAQNMQSDL